MSTSAADHQADRARLAPPRRSRAWRWVAVFVAVSALHWVAAEWFARHHGAPPPLAQVRVPVQVALLKPERIEQQARPAASAPAKSKPAAPARPKRATSAPHTLQAVAPPAPHPKAPAAPEAAQAASSPSTETASASTANGASGTTAAAAPGNGSHPSAQAQQASHGVKFSVPPSGELQYDTFFNGARNQPGTIHWKSDGKRYEMVVSIPLPFVGTFSWTSRGHVDAFGLAPEQYIEKRGRRPEDFTIFNRNEKQIVFTRTPNSLALPDGAQDRFSMVMQLASLVRGDPDAYKPGVTREFYVADNDSGETWPITTIGDETVSTDHGYVTARHFMRLPRHAGDKRRIDVWLAPSLGWLPVRLVQTEPNGTEVELLWRGALSVPTASNDMSDAAPGASGAANGAASGGANGAANGGANGAANDTAQGTPNNAMTSSPAPLEAAPAPTSAAPADGNGGMPPAASPSATPSPTSPSSAQSTQSSAPQMEPQPAQPTPAADTPMHP
ncbi:DUF3108 domain-containing protein [Paraburkholderia pallida]|uniref:DUF3108 domain-containing protein n=1 Tax=Paraburkholderia pallida TaxID=2547399 RepID=A0A4P7CNC3_9BURK|nr:DUF3108 domain-containing protein [Paraburkholderia pallida]QBQ96036.1 DUF3108 domain-containing protein [Paraburkholderia pallida]